MSDKEIIFLVKVGASLGVDKIRLTGGEPTIRPGVVELVREMAAIPGIRDVAMTTNALLLDELAQPLADAGLNRVNISIDTIDPNDSGASRAGVTLMMCGGALSLPKRRGCDR